MSKSAVSLSINEFDFMLSQFRPDEKFELLTKLQIEYNELPERKFEYVSLNPNKPTVLKSINARSLAEADAKLAKLKRNKKAPKEATLVIPTTTMKIIE